MVQIAKGKKVGTIAALVLSIVMAPVLYTGVRYMFFHLGVSREYGWSLLRIGHKEINLRFKLAAQINKRHRFLNGPVYAKKGETLRIRYRVSPAKDSSGSLGLNLSPFLDSRSTWHREFRSPAAGTVKIHFKEGHFYMFALSYSLYLGKAEVDWSVEH